MRFSNDGSLLATGCNHYTQIFNVTTGQLVCKLVDQGVSEDMGDLYIRTVCFSPDGTLLATGAEDGIIRIWHIASKTIRLILRGHEQDIYCLDWSVDGAHIVSGSGDKSVRVLHFILKVKVRQSLGMGLKIRAMPQDYGQWG